MINVNSRHSGPVVVGPRGTRSLTRAGHGAGQVKAYDEKFLQQLVYDHPGVIPMADIEPAFTPLVSVCQELETPNGYLDNLWITPDGGVILGECKLVKNSQARREVVAQALDYARAVSAFSFEELEHLAGKARREPSFTLWSLVSKGNTLDEGQFHDAVQRRLDTGHVMVLIVGDGIREGAHTLSAYLQLHAGFHAGLALVDMSVWESGDDSLIVVPCVPMRTVLVERGIVRVDAGVSVKIDPPSSGGPGGVPNGRTASETEFYDQLRTRAPEVVEPLRSFVSRLHEAGITPEFRKSLVLRWAPGPDVSGSAGYIDSLGYAWLGDSFLVAGRLGNDAAARRYLEALAAAVGGRAKVAVEETSRGVLGPQGRTVNLVELLPAQDQWLGALQAFTTELSESLKGADDSLQ